MQIIIFEYPYDLSMVVRDAKQTQPVSYFHLTEVVCVIGCLGNCQE